MIARVYWSNGRLMVEWHSAGRVYQMFAYPFVGTLSPTCTTAIMLKAFPKAFTGSTADRLTG